MIFFKNHIVYFLILYGLTGSRDITKAEKAQSVYIVLYRTQTTWKNIN